MPNPQVFEEQRMKWRYFYNDFFSQGTSAWKAKTEKWLVSSEPLSAFPASVPELFCANSSIGWKCEWRMSWMQVSWLHETCTGKNGNLLIDICNNLHNVCMKSKYMSVWERNSEVYLNYGSRPEFNVKWARQERSTLWHGGNADREEEEANVKPFFLTSIHDETFLSESHQTFLGILVWTFKKHGKCWFQPWVTFSAWWCFQAAFSFQQFVL